jgi:hypothetical protein
LPPYEADSKWARNRSKNDFTKNNMHDAYSIRFPTGCPRRFKNPRCFSHPLPAELWSTLEKRRKSGHRPETSCATLQDYKANFKNR